MSSESESYAKTSSSTYHPTYYRNLYYNKRAGGGSDASCEVTGDSNQEESGDDTFNYNLRLDGSGGRKRGNNSISTQQISYDSSKGVSRYSQKRPKLNSDFNNNDFNSAINTIQSEILNGAFPRHSVNDEDEAVEDLHSMAVEWSSDDSNGEKLAYRDDIPTIPTTSELSVAAVLLLQHSCYIDRNRNGDCDDSDDHRSIATSLFVEVASVDECGSYQGYGGASESEKDDDGECDDDDGTMSDYFSLDTVDRSMLPNATNGTMSSFDNRNKSFEDGYDGASETGRAETEVDDDAADDLETDSSNRNRRRGEMKSKHKKESNFSSNSSNGSIGSVRRGIMRKSKNKSKKVI